MNSFIENDGTCYTSDKKMTEKNDQKTDSMTEEEEDNLLESEEQESQLDPKQAKHKRPTGSHVILCHANAMLCYGMLNQIQER